MSRRRRWARRAVGLAAAGIALLLLGVWTLLSTAPGLHLAWKIARGYLPEELSIAAVSGTVRGPIEIEGLEYETSSVRVTVDRGTVAWSLPALFERRIELLDLEAEGIRVVLAEPSEAAEPDEARRDSLPTITLPLPLRLARGVARHLVLADAAGPDPVFVLDSVTITEAAFRTELQLAELVAEAPEGTLRLSGSVRTQGRYPFDVHAEVAGQLPDPVPFAEVVADLSGDLDTIDLTAASTLPLTATLAGRVETPLDRPRLALRLEAEETAFRTLMPEAPEGSGGGVFQLQGPLDSLRVTGSARGTTPATGGVDLDFAIERRVDRILVERLLAGLGATRVDAAGTVGLAAETAPTLDLTASWTDARWPLEGEPTVRSPSGSARVRGTAEQYGLDANAEVVVRVPPESEDDRSSESGDEPSSESPLRVVRPSQLEGRVEVHGAGTPNWFDIRDISVDAMDGSLRGDGRVAWNPGVAWDVGFEVHDLLLGPLLSDSSLADATATLAGRTRGTFAPDRLIAELALDTLRAVARGLPMEGAFRGDVRLPLAAGGPVLTGADLRIEHLAAEWGGVWLEASGTIADTVDLTLDAEVPEIRALTSRAAGRAAVALRAGGMRVDPEIDLAIDASALTFGDDLPSMADPSMTEDGGVAPAAIDTLLVRVAGRVSNHRAETRLVRGEITVDATAAGGYADSSWAGDLTSLTVVQPVLDAWTLRDPAALRLSPTEADLGQACLVQEPAEFCSSGRWTADGPVSASAEIRGLTGVRLATLLPEGWTMTSGISGRLVADLTSDGTLRADGTIDFEEGVVRYPVGTGARTLRYAASSITASVGEEGARLDFGTAMTEETGTQVVDIEGGLALPGYRNVRDSIGAQPVEGSMHAEVRDFGPLYAFLPSLGEITGEARADLDIAGTVSDPAITGQARVRGGSVDVVPLGIRLQEIEITATGRGRGGLDVEGSLRSGTGVLSVTGRLPVAPTPEDPGTLRLNGTRVHAVGLPEVSAWVSPDLEIVAVPDVIRVSGTVTLPVATIEVTEVPTTAARTSRDVVFVDDTTEVASGPGALQFQVRVVVGDSVTFRGFGFSARPEGAVLASQGAGGTIIGTGDVNLRDGRYFAYGQELQIERGRILFGGGPIDNPGLDVRASRTASDGTIAGLLIRGTLEDPLVTTFSEPAMSESEALSYIVLGGPLDQDSGDRSQVGAAATALGLQRGNQIAGRWGRSLGLDEMRVEAGATLEEASLVAGTYLSPKLYVSYGVGLFEPISTFRLRYFLSRRWSIRAETGAENGADLLFRIERGR